MIDLNEKKRRRFVFLHHLYEITNGNIHCYLMVEDVGNDLTWTRDETYEVVDYLQGERLVETAAMESRVAISHKGVREVEAALSSPNLPTTYFPAASNVLIVHGSVNNSPIQQGSHTSTQTVSYAAEQSQDLQEFLIRVKQELPHLQLASEDQSQAEAQVTTMQAQLTAPRPNWDILKAAGEALYGILLGVTGNLATDMLKCWGWFQIMIGRYLSELH